MLLLDTRSLPGLLRAIADLGAATGQEAKAEAILGRFDEALKTARAKAAGKRRPRVLFAVMHSYQDLGAIMEIHIIGRDGFYNELIEAAEFLEGRAERLGALAQQLRSPSKKQTCFYQELFHLTFKIENK